MSKQIFNNRHYIQMAQVINASDKIVIRIYTSFFMAYNAIARFKILMISMLLYNDS